MFFLSDMLNKKLKLPTAAEAPEWGDFEFTDGAGALGVTHVQKLVDRAYLPLEWKYPGDVGHAATYRVISNARRATLSYGPLAGVRQDGVDLLVQRIARLLGLVRERAGVHRLGGSPMRLRGWRRRGRSHAWAVHEGSRARIRLLS